MYDVVILTLEEPRSGCGSACGCGAPTPGADACATGEKGHDCDGDCGTCEQRPRTPVLHCSDALTAAGARVEAVTAYSDAEIDAVLARFDAPEAADGLRRPDPETKSRLVLAVASDGQLSHVVYRMVRRWAPAPSKRPADLPDGRTVFDLPPLAVLPLDKSASSDLAGRLGLPRNPADVARAVLSGEVRRLDLLRHDGGAVTIDGALLGAADQYGRFVPWRGRVEVDDHLLSDGEEQVLACAVAVADGYAEVGGMALVAAPDPADGMVDVAVAVPVVDKKLFGRDRQRIEVRRARGRAVAVTPRLPADDLTLPFVEDGVTGELTRKRSWWIERRAWGVHV